MQGPAGKYTVTAYYSDYDASTTFVLAPVKLPPPSLTVKTDKNGYEQKDTVLISGTVGGFNEYTGPVGITVKGPHPSREHHLQWKFTYCY